MYRPDPIRHFALPLSLLAAALAAAPTASAGPLDELPPLQNGQGVPFRTGGIGAPQAALLKAEAPHHSLTLLFYVAQPDGKNAYTAMVPVAIETAAGQTVLQTVTDGPFLLADLPAGDYVVRVNDHGQPLQRRVHLGGTPVQLPIAVHEPQHSLAPLVVETPPAAAAPAPAAPAATGVANPATAQAPVPLDVPPEPVPAAPNAELAPPAADTLPPTQQP